MSNSDSGNRREFSVLKYGLLAAVVIWITWALLGKDIARHLVAIGAPQAVQSIEASSPQLPEKSVSAAVSPVHPDQKQELSMDARSQFFSELGQTGDSFGGLNALLTAIAGAIVAWAGYMQYLTLKQARSVAVEERDNRSLQEFESLFFRLLEMCERAADRVEGPPRSGQSTHINPETGPESERLPGRVGPRALDSYARRVFELFSRSGPNRNGIAELERLVKIYLKSVYYQRPSALGPYFRLLFQTFKHISESKLSEEMKIRYANIARGQISDGAVLLLALNGLTSRGYKFISHIERYGLLEHLHRRYFSEFFGVLQLGYRKRAFLGSQERQKPGNEYIEKPLINLELLSGWDVVLNGVDEDEDFESGYQGS